MFACLDSLSAFGRPLSGFRFLVFFFCRYVLGEAGGSLVFSVIGLGCVALWLFSAQVGQCDVFLGRVV